MVDKSQPFKLKNPSSLS